MVKISVPTPGTVDTSFSPHADCTMLYTEQLAWWQLKMASLMFTQGFEVVNYRDADGETKPPSDFLSAMGDIDELSNILTSLQGLATSLSSISGKQTDIAQFTEDLATYLSSIQTVVDLFPDTPDLIKKFVYEFAGIDIDYDGNPKDGLSELKSFIDSDTTALATWLGNALLASENDDPIPALPVLALITKFVPAKWALVAKFAVDIGFRLLMSWVKGRLEHPDAKLEGLDPLVEVLKAGLLDSNELAWLSPAQPTWDSVIELDLDGSQTIRVKPRWNSIETDS